MDARLAEALARIIAKFGFTADVADVEAYLSEEGYDAGQIGTIVSAWMLEIRAKRASTITAIRSTMRVLGPHEKGRFEPEAWGFLVSLAASGWISGEELEHVIERSLAQWDNKITIDDIRSVFEPGVHDSIGKPGESGVVH